MSGAAQLLTIMIAVGSFVLVLFLVRRRLLRESYALTWLIVGAGMVLLALARPLLDRLSDILGIRSGTTTLFLIAVLVILAVQVQLSIALSRLEERLRDLAETIALGNVTPGTEPGDPLEDSDHG